MALVSGLINTSIDYGSPIDERMSVTQVPTSLAAPIVSEKPISFCPEGQKYLGKNALGKPICTANVRYRNKDKQVAYEKAKAEKITWTGQYTKNEETGEVTPKPLEVLLEEAKSGVVQVVEEDNLLKKYWWVLAAIGVYIIISND